MYEKETIIDKIGKVITKLGTALMINLMFLICCIPIVTIGQAWAALLSALRYQIRGDSWWAGFKFGFKTRFLRGTVAWCMLGTVDVLMFNDILVNLDRFVNGEPSLPRLIISGIMFTLMAMLTISFIVLNVYIPTDVNNWTRNALAVLYKAPLHLLGAAVLFCLPVLVFFFAVDFFYYFLMIFVVAYFILAGLGITILLKNVLVKLLTAARADGTLIAEEGRNAAYFADDEEEEEEEEEE